MKRTPGTIEKTAKKISILIMEKRREIDELYEDSMVLWKRMGNRSESGSKGKKATISEIDKINKIKLKYAQLGDKE